MVRCRVRAFAVRFDSLEQFEFESVALVHAEILLRVAHRVLGQPAAAQDAVQETLLSAWRSFHQFKRETNCRAWLFKIMFRVINGGRQRDLKLPIVELLDGYDLDHMIIAIEGERKIAHSDVLAAIDSLPTGQRAVLMLAAVEGFTCKEISSILRIPVGTVMSRLSRARTDVRNALCSTAKVHTALRPHRAERKRHDL